jgi:hypothetical protein
MTKEQTQVRMEPSLKKRIRRYQEKALKKDNIELSFGDATRALLRKALEAEGIH